LLDRLGAEIPARLAPQIVGKPRARGRKS